MICLTRLNQKSFYLNSDLIEMVEETPDTLITMTTGKRFLVADSAEQVLDKIICFRNRCFRDVTVQVYQPDDFGGDDRPLDSGDEIPVAGEA